MPYRDGNPTLGEQIEEDRRARYYTNDILKEARQDRDEIKRLRTALKQISDGAENQDIDHREFRIKARQCADAALHEE